MLSVGLLIFWLNKYKIFNLSEIIGPQQITDIIRELIFLVSDTRSVSYINPHGAKTLGLKQNGKIAAKEMFAHFGNAYAEFDENRQLRKLEHKTWEKEEKVGEHKECNYLLCL